MEVYIAVLDGDGYVTPGHDDSGRARLWHQYHRDWHIIPPVQLRDGTGDQYLYSRSTNGWYLSFEES